MITEFLLEFITNFIASAGYIGLIFLMALESMVFPVPSEAVMPFAGFLVADGKFSFAGIVFFSTLGSLIGSLVSYFIGLFGGRPFVKRFGKYVFLDERKLDLIEKYFKKYGEITIFICRFIPVIRHIISISAGIGKMNFFKFSIFTILGAGIWNFFLAYVGYILKNNWQEISKYTQIFDFILIVGCVLVFAYYIKKKYDNSSKNKLRS